MIFTDGGAYDKGNGKFKGFSSFRIFNEKGSLVKENCFVLEEGTTPLAEITAIAVALYHAYKIITEFGKKDDIEFELYTDSMLCYNSLTSWIFNWIKNAINGIFYSSNKKPVLNQNVIKTAFDLILKINKIGGIKLFHINSHVAAKNIDKLKIKFEKFNKCKITNDKFLFIYLQNSKCDQAIKDKFNEVSTNTKSDKK